MRGERVSIDGRVGEFGDFAPDELLSANFVYQKVAVFGRRVVAPELAVEVLNTAYAALYSDASGRYADERLSADRCGDGYLHANMEILQSDTMAHEITALLDANGYPVAGGALVAVYVFPDAEGRAVRLISCEKQLAWRDFSHTTGVKALVLPCDVPFAGYRTAASLTAQTCAKLYARRRGLDAAISENAAGILTTLDDAPLFVAAGGRVFAAPAAESAERRMGMTACSAAGLELHEQCFTVADLPHFDEIFAFTPQGVTSVGELGGRSLPHSLAARVCRSLVG